MKNPPRREQSNGTSTKYRRKQASHAGRWEFNVAGQSLFPLGAKDRPRRAAYRSPTGDLRFLSLG